MGGVGRNRRPRCSLSLPTVQALSRKAALSLSSTVWGRPLFLMGAPECDGNAHYDGVQIGLSGETSDELLKG